MSTSASKPQRQGFDRFYLPPNFEDCYYNNYILFLPYVELDQKDGEYRLGFTAKIYDEVTKPSWHLLLIFSSAITKKGKTSRREYRHAHG
jgi:hypothetical protein